MVVKFGASLQKGLNYWSTWRKSCVFNVPLDTRSFSLVIITSLFTQYMEFLSISVQFWLFRALLFWRINVMQKTIFIIYFLKFWFLFFTQVFHFTLSKTFMRIETSMQCIIISELKIKCIKFNATYRSYRT